MCLAVIQTTAVVVLLKQQVEVILVVLAIKVMFW